MNHQTYKLALTDEQKAEVKRIYSLAQGQRCLVVGQIKPNSTDLEFVALHRDDIEWLGLCISKCTLAFEPIPASPPPSEEGLHSGFNPEMKKAFNAWVAAAAKLPSHPNAGQRETIDGYNFIAVEHYKPVEQKKVICWELASPSSFESLNISFAEFVIREK